MSFCEAAVCVKFTSKLVQLPVLTRIAAGEPADSNHEAFLRTFGSFSLIAEMAPVPKLIVTSREAAASLTRI